MAEYGHFITTTSGGQIWFVEGCSQCSISTGGLHEYGCPLYKPRDAVNLIPKGETDA